MSLFFQDYFVSRRIRREIQELYFSIAIRNFSVAMIAIFEPVYIFVMAQNNGFSFSRSLMLVMLFYAICYTLYFFVIPLGGKVAAYFGFEHALFYSLPVFIIYYLALAAMEAKFLLFFILASILLALYKMLFWPAFHANFARYGQMHQRGKEISNLVAGSAIVAILGPIAGGVILTFFDFTVLFIIVSIMLLISTVPLFTTKEKFKSAHFPYWIHFKKLFWKQYIKETLCFMGYAEELIALTIWPIFMFLILKGYVYLGGISTLAILFAASFALIIGRISDRFSRRKIIRASSFLYMLTWLTRIIIKFPYQVLITDIFGRITKGGISVPLTAIIYNRGRRDGNLNYAVFFEMALVMGKMLACWGLFFYFAYFADFTLPFIAGALSSLLYMIF